MHTGVLLSRWGGSERGGVSGRQSCAVGTWQWLCRNRLVGLMAGVEASNAGRLCCAVTRRDDDDDNEMIDEEDDEEGEDEERKREGGTDGEKRKAIGWQMNVQRSPTDFRSGLGTELM